MQPMHHVITAQQFSAEQMGELFEKTDDMIEQVAAHKRELVQRYAGEIMVSFFYESSTRTRISFEMAAMRLGMAVVSTENAREFSSVSKGETLEHTIKVLNKYKPAAIVMRHDETGGAARAAAVSEVPIINAGDGRGEHPTQALLDMYTISKYRGGLSDLQVVVGGDLANGRTARSLAQLLAVYPNNSLRFVSTPELGMGEDIKQFLREHQTEFSETSDMKSALQDADVVYWTRLQKERLKEGATTTSDFVIDRAAMNILPGHAILMHPLPIDGEISPEIDNDPRAVYFDQAGNGQYIRMALMDTILSNQ